MECRIYTLLASGLLQWMMSEVDEGNTQYASKKSKI